MRRLRSGIAATAVTVLALALGACGSQDDQGGGDVAATTATTAVKVAAESDFDPGRFSDPVAIDNQWFPLKPGTQLTWEGSALVLAALFGCSLWMLSMRVRSLDRLR